MLDARARALCVVRDPGFGVLRPGVPVALLLGGTTQPSANASSFLTELVSSYT